MKYPTYIINRATWTLYIKNSKEGEFYGDFLKRVYTDFDLDAACEDELKLERVETGTMSD